MSVDPKSEDGQTLRKLFPFETMPARQYNALCSACEITEASNGNFLFKLGDVPDSFIYLLQGSVSLEAEEFKIETISAGTDIARFAIAHQFPRQISARAMDEVRYVSLQLNAFDKQAIEVIEEESNYMVENEDDLEKELSGDWMSAMLQSPIFQRLPAMNLQQVLMSLEDVEIKQGEVIFNQGDSGDYYYLIKKGRCALSRKASERAKEIKLLELRKNETFGEDALLSDEPRSMTITAITDMILSRIDKETFTKLIKEPALTYIDYPQLMAECKQDEAIVIDIRSTDEYKKNHIEGSRSIPFFSLRMSLKELGKESKKIIIICDEGKISKAAAFVLIKYGMDAEILQGGMQSVPAREGEATFTIDESIGEEETVGVGEGSRLLRDEETIENHRPEIQIDSSLEQENKSLKEENERLTMELGKIKKQYKLLYTQTEKLKAAFDSLQSSK